MENIAFFDEQIRRFEEAERQYSESRWPKWLRRKVTKKAHKLLISAIQELKERRETAKQKVSAQKYRFLDIAVRLVLTPRTDIKDVAGKLAWLAGICQMLDGIDDISGFAAVEKEINEFKMSQQVGGQGHAGINSQTAVD